MRYKIAHGGRGSAKSWSVARLLIARAMKLQTRWLCTREFQSSIRESVHHLLSDQIEMLGYGSEFDIQRDCIKHKTNGSEFSFKGLHDESLDSLKSYEGYDGAWIEEGQSISRRSIQFLDPTIRKAGSEIWVTMNPENDDDAIWTDFVKNPPSNAIIEQVNWYDNPWFNDVLRAIKDKDYARDPDAAAWIWGGQIRAVSDKQVLRGKCETMPFEPNPLLWDGPYFGIDWGYGDDPVALIRFWLWQDCLYIEYEAYGTHCEIEDHIALFDTVPGARENVVRADNSRPEMVSHIRRNGYSRILSGKKWPGCVEARVSWLKSFHRIYIHPRCPRIALEGKLWSWKVNKLGEVIRPNILVPGNDHGWDAVGYGGEAHVLGRIKHTPKEPPEDKDPFGQWRNASGGSPYGGL